MQNDQDQPQTPAPEASPEVTGQTAEAIPPIPAQPLPVTIGTNKPLPPQPTHYEPDKAMPVGVSASDLDINVGRPKLPVGIYILAGLALLEAIFSFLDTSSNDWYTIAMLVDLVLAVTLLARVEFTRKAVVVFQAVTIILSIIVIIGLAAIQARVKQLESQFNQAVSSLDTKQLTTQDKTKLNSLKHQIATQDKQLGKSVKAAYTHYAIDIAVSAGMIIYLTRPRIKAVFDPESLA